MYEEYVWNCIFRYFRLFHMLHMSAYKYFQFQLFRLTSNVKCLFLKFPKFYIIHSSIFTSSFLFFLSFIGITIIIMYLYTMLSQCRNETQCMCIGRLMDMVGIRIPIPIPFNIEYPFELVYVYVHTFFA